MDSLQSALVLLQVQTLAQQVGIEPLDLDIQKSEQVRTTAQQFAQFGFAWMN
jgi:hypothetical protein